MQTRQYDKLKDILRQMFHQMDQSDLDFGIYRIMNANRDEIEKFLDVELLPQVKEEIVLRPLNKSFDPIVLPANEEGKFRVAGVFIDVLRTAEEII